MVNLIEDFGAYRKQGEGILKELAHNYPFLF